MAHDGHHRHAAYLIQHGGLRGFAPEEVALLAALRLDDAELMSSEDVEDPAGGDLPIFRACAHEISDLIDQLVPELEANVAPDEEIA